MTVRDLDIQILLPNNTVSIGGLTKSAKIYEGQRVTSWHEDPGRVTLNLEVIDNFISADSSGTYPAATLEGQRLRMIARKRDHNFGTFFEGRIKAIKFQGQSQGPIKQVTLEAYDLEDQISRGEQDVTDPILTVTRVPDQEISLTNLYSPSRTVVPRGIAVTNDRFWILDAGTGRKVFAWNRETRKRDTGSDFTLPGSNNYEAIATDGNDLLWLIDSTDRIARAYSRRKRFVRFSDGDITLPRTANDVLWAQFDRLENEDGGLIYRSGVNIYDNIGTLLYTLDAGNTTPAGLLELEVGAGPTATNQLGVWSGDKRTLYFYSKITTPPAGNWVRDSANDRNVIRSSGPEYTQNRNTEGGECRAFGMYCNLVERYWASSGIELGPRVQATNQIHERLGAININGSTIRGDGTGASIPSNTPIFRIVIGHYTGGFDSNDRLETYSSINSADMRFLGIAGDDTHLVIGVADFAYEDPAPRLYRFPNPGTSTQLQLYTTPGRASSGLIVVPYTHEAQPYQIDDTLLNLTGRVLLGYNSGKYIHYGSASADGWQSPPVRLWPGEDEIEDGSSLPSRMVAFRTYSDDFQGFADLGLTDNTLDWIRHNRFAISDRFLFTVDLIDNASGTGTEDMTSIITTRWLNNGARITSLQLSIPSDFTHPADGAGTKHQWAVSSMYWDDNNDRLMLAFGRILETGEGNQLRLQIGFGQWFAYRIATPNIVDWRSANNQQFGGANVVTTDIAQSDEHYWALDAGDTAVICYDRSYNRVTSRDFNLHADNDNPDAIEVVGDIIYVADAAEGKCFAYNSATGNHISPLDFTLTQSSITGMTYDKAGQILYICSGTALQAYQLASEPPTPQAVSDFDIDLDPDDDFTGSTPSGAVTDSEYMYVSWQHTSGVATKPRITAHNLETKARDTNKDITVSATGLATNVVLQGLALSGNALYAASPQFGDNGGFFAFDKRFRLRDTPKDFALINPVGTPEGAAFAGDHLYTVLDHTSDDRMHVYNLTFDTLIQQPAETIGQRYKHFAELAAGRTLPKEIVGTPELSEVGIRGSIRDALRRSINSDIVRAVRGVVHPRGRWAINEDTGGPSSLTIDDAALVISDSHDGAVLPTKPPVRSQIHNRLANQLIMTDFEGGEYALLETDSAATYGRKKRDVPTFGQPSRVVAVANWLNDHWAKPFPVLEIECNLLFETDANASAALFARPHTPITASYTDENTGAITTLPWLVLNRELDVKTRSAAVEVAIKFVLAPPRQFGVGWRLDGPNEIIEDRLGENTVLVDGEY